MRPHRIPLIIGVALAAAAGTPVAHATSITVRTDRQFHEAARDLRSSGGTIVLAPRRYDRLTVGTRSNRLLHVVGRPGATVRVLRLRGTRHVRVTGLRVRDGRLLVKGSHHVGLDRVDVQHAQARLLGSGKVTVSRSRFAYCGDGKVCLLLGGSHRVTVERSSFRDCAGCDFIRGRVGVFLTVRGNTFHRALYGPCGADPKVCNHQDLVQIDAGHRVLIEGNTFGVYEGGAAQVYLARAVVGATIRGNRFLREDPRVPGLVAAAGIVVGANTPGVLPAGVLIEGNEILSGAWRPGGPASPDGVESSVILSAGYAASPAEERPILARNVLALARTPERLCALLAASVANRMFDGVACSDTDVVGPPAG